MDGVIVGLDIGTSFIKVLIGELDSEENIKIIGFAKKPSKGLRNGVIVNIDAAAQTIKETIEEAEQMAGIEVQEVCTAIGNSQVESLNHEGNIVVDNSNRKRCLEISEDAKERAIESAKAIHISMEKQLLTCVPQEYFIDDLPPCKNPIGVMGIRLGVKVHLVLASVTACENIDECIRRAGYSNIVICSKLLATSVAIINEEERELGSILIDMGAGSTDVIVINKDYPVYITSIPLGSDYVTSDIAAVEGIPYAAAEKIKVEYGCCWMPEQEDDKEVLLPPVGGRAPVQTFQSELCEIIQPRIIEIFKMAKDNVVHHSGLTSLNGSIILVGGGALMQGIVPLAQQIWGTTSVRIGEISNYGDIDQSYRDASYATALGLVVANKEYAISEKSRSKRTYEGDFEESSIRKTAKNIFKKFF